MGLFLKPVKKGQKIPIDKAVVFFGRHPDCDVVLTRSRKVSRKHCCIAQVDDRLVIRDLGSMNGIKVNGERVRKVKDLSLGDEVTIGDISYNLTNDSVASEKPKKKPVKKKQDQGKQEQKQPTRNPSRKKKKPEKNLNLSMDFPVPIDEDDEDENEEEVTPSKTEKGRKKKTPSSLPLASLNEIEDDEVFDELGADDLEEDNDEDFYEFDYDVDDIDDDSDEDIIILDD